MLIRLPQVLCNSHISTTTSLVTDRGTEYMPASFQQFLRDKSICHRTSIAGTPQQNGCSERFIQIPKDKTSAILIGAGLPPAFWAEAVRHTAFLHNCIPSAIHKFRLPDELVFGHKDATLRRCLTFGQRVWAQIDRVTAFAPRATKCIFLGFAFDRGTKAMRLKRVDTPGNGGIILARDVNNENVALLLYVNNGLLAASKCAAEKLFGILLEPFNIKVRGEITKAGKSFLGRILRYNRKLGDIRISQEPAITQALRDMHLENLKRVHSPIQNRVDLRLNDGNRLLNNNKYLKGVGHFGWIAQTRPDITYATICLPVLSQNQQQLICTTSSASSAT